ncbi:07abcd88-6a02-4be8-ba5f-8a4c55719574 [Thermothielavioides terrestris]|uniref:07abcd88-6a02-4be8-ba5f-8a4c55719574 n=1 Tax=Thermothielavioides terrestris TaxID=2587410 RepID=A0A446BXZ6_9PEZI|nr:07abcd88-6a02-4be8-ba5f-8a4c55719574 [Thermothielavioides terrestris]
MAPELRKRKSKLAEPEPAAKKTKATKATPKAEKRKAAEDASPVAVKKRKPSKDATPSKKAAASVEDKAAPKKSAVKKEKQSPKAKSASERPSKVAKQEEGQHEDVRSDVEEDEIDDETMALVKTLDSGDDEEPENPVTRYKTGQDVGKIPKPKKSKTSSSSSDKPGVMYLGRIPHGFYEHELRSYFGQFGEITRLRLVRNKKTGASRHRAFIEFADAEVADIAARTMDKYLLFGHILQAQIVPPEQVHPNLFKGANRRFKVVPWNKMAGRQLERPLSESQWQVRISKEEQRRAARAEKLKAMGYEFDAPPLKPAVAKQLLENGTEEEAPKALEAAPAAEEAEPTEEKQVAVPEAVEGKGATVADEATPQKKKGKKGKKTKS